MTYSSLVLDNENYSHSQNKHLGLFMLQTFIVTLREGIEAFLIVAVTLTYLAKTGRTHLFKPVYYGIGGAILASSGVAFAVTQMGHKALTEGLFAVAAALLVVSLTVHMLRVGKHMKKTITSKIDKHSEKEGFAASLGIFSFVVLMMTREGFEIVLLLKSISSQEDAMMMAIGGSLGVLGAVAVGVMWIKYSKYINVGRFLKVTALFLIMFSVHLFLYGAHELAETKWFADGIIHEIGESYSKKNLFVKLFNFGIIIVPVLWLASAAIKERLLKKPALAA